MIDIDIEQNKRGKIISPRDFLWRTSLRLSYATSHDECCCVWDGGVEPVGNCTYLHLSLVASSTATSTFELQIHILIVAQEKKPPIIHFQLTPLEYIVAGTKTVPNSKLIMMNVRW
jgi:hypothetical protein